MVNLENLPERRLSPVYTWCQSVRHVFELRRYYGIDMHLKAKMVRSCELIFKWRGDILFGNLIKDGIKNRLDK